MNPSPTPQIIKYIGLDVHAQTVAVAIAQQGGDVLSYGTIPAHSHSMDRLHHSTFVPVPDEADEAMRDPAYNYSWRHRPPLRTFHPDRYHTCQAHNWGRAVPTPLAVRCSRWTPRDLAGHRPTHAFLTHGAIEAAAGREGARLEREVCQRSDRGGDGPSPVVRLL